MARERGGGTRFGAVLDATCDRISDGAVFCGLLWWIAFGLHDRLLVVATLICLVTSQVISYIKARAEASGLRGDGGIIERPERLIIVLVGAGVSDFPFVAWPPGAAGGDVAAGGGQPGHRARSGCTRCGLRPARRTDAAECRRPREAGPGPERASRDRHAGGPESDRAATTPGEPHRDRLGVRGRLDGRAGDAGIRRPHRIRHRGALCGPPRRARAAAQEPGPRHRCAAGRRAGRADARLAGLLCPLLAGGVPAADDGPPRAGPPARRLGRWGKTIWMRRWPRAAARCWRCRTAATGTWPGCGWRRRTAPSPPSRSGSNPNRCTGVSSPTAKASASKCCRCPAANDHPSRCCASGCGPTGWCA